MKVLDIKNMAKYSFMSASLLALEKGDLEGALTYALMEMKSNDRTTLERVDVAIYIGKIYSEMSEFRACTAMLMRTLRYGIEHDRIFAVMSYNFYRAGEEELGNIYNAMMVDWSERHDRNVDFGEYLRENIKHHSEERGDARSHVPFIDKAWQMAMSGDTKGARAELMKVDIGYEYEQYELLMALDMLDNSQSVEAKRLFDRILSMPLKGGSVMRLFYAMDRTGNMDGILRLCEKAIAEDKCTMRLTEIYAIALLNVGRETEAIRIISKLDVLFGDVFPRLRAMRYMAKRRKGIYPPVYNANYRLNVYRVMRDGIIERDIEGKSVDEILANSETMSLIYSMYEEGIDSDICDAVTSKLVASERGRNVLRDILLDVNVETSNMRVYLVRALIDYTSDIAFSLANIYNTSTYVAPSQHMNGEMLSKYKDDMAFRMVSGEE